MWCPSGHTRDAALGHFRQHKFPGATLAFISDFLRPLRRIFQKIPKHDDGFGPGGLCQSGSTGCGRRGA